MALKPTPHGLSLIHIWGCRNLLLIGLEPEDVLEMLQLSLPFETDTILTYQTFEPIVGIVVVEGTDILARTFVETVLQFDIVEAVSYTHLDVYKRQLRKHPIRIHRN